MTNDNDRIWLETLSTGKYNENNPIEKEANLIRKSIIKRRNLIESEVLSDNLANKINEELLRDGFYKKTRNKLGVILSFISGSVFTALATFLINLNSISTRSISNEANIYSGTVVNLPARSATQDWAIKLLDTSRFRLR